MTMHSNAERVEKVVSFYRDYYRDEIGVLAQHYPNEQTTLEVDYMDVWRWNEDIAEDWLDQPGETQGTFEYALTEFDLPADVDLTEARVVVTNLPESHTYYPNQMDTSVTGYVAVRGKVARVTTKDEIPLEAVYECQRCGTITRIKQSPGGLQEPNECHGCERKGPFEIDDSETGWEDYCKVRVETPPDKAGTANAEHLDGFCVGEPVHEGGEHGLIGRAGEDVIVYGTVERHEKDADEGLFKRVLNVETVEFPNDGGNVDVEKHREEFMELANGDTPIEDFAESISPELYKTEAWETGMEWAVAYLFAAPRVDVPNGPTYRGDIHGAIISDFGMGKSMFREGLAAYSPNSIVKSATGLSSDVGLTAAAVKDDFGSGQWTLKPGILVRGDGGHVILDEIDKGPEDLSSINDAIEGEQQVDVDKAGLSATYNSRCGVLVLGNPEDGRFKEGMSRAAQIDVDDSTLSRFDGIITMRDDADEEIDSKIAEQALKAYSEGQEVDFGDREELDVLEREVPVDVGRAWVKYARENVFPLLKEEHIEDVKEWYATEVRQLNHKFNDETEVDDMPVPVSTRVVMWVAKYAVAFARVELCDEVQDRHIERAMPLAKRLVSQNWDGEKFDVTSTTNSSQQERRDAVVSALSEGPMTVGEVAEEVRKDYDVVRNDLKKDPRVNQLPNNRFEQA